MIISCWRQIDRAHPPAAPKLTAGIRASNAIKIPAASVDVVLDRLIYSGRDPRAGVDRGEKTRSNRSASA